MIQVFVKRRQKFCTRLFLCSDICAVHAHPGFDERSNQPGPNGALMIDRIPGARVAFIVSCITAFAWRERAQTERCEQKHFHCFNHMVRFFRRQQRERQSADCKDLVRTKRKINYTGLMIAIDYVSQVTGVFVPEFGFESGATLFEKCSPARGNFCTDVDVVEPQRLNFHRLSDTWCDLMAIDSRIHPSELLAVLASREQSIAIGADAKARPFVVTGEDCFDRCAQFLCVTIVSERWLF